MKIGVLALQGAVTEHLEILKRLKVDTIQVKLPDDINGLDGLIIPGGESTTIGQLIVKGGLDKAITERYKKGMPIYGTCAGAIILAKDIDTAQPKLGLMDISVTRNGYGRQIDSFEADLDIDNIGKFKGVFIRAPIVDCVNDGVKVLSTFNNRPVMAEQGHLMITTFHPELTDDTRVHKHFIEMVKYHRLL